MILEQPSPLCFSPDKEEDMKKSSWIRLLQIAILLMYAELDPLLEELELEGRITRTAGGKG